MLCPVRFPVKLIYIEGPCLKVRKGLQNLLIRMHQKKHLQSILLHGCRSSLLECFFHKYAVIFISNTVLSKFYSIIVLSVAI